MSRQSTQLKVSSTAARHVHEDEQHEAFGWEFLETRKLEAIALRTDIRVTLEQYPGSPDVISMDIEGEGFQAARLTNGGAILRCEVSRFRGNPAETYRAIGEAIIAVTAEGDRMGFFDAARQHDDKLREAGQDGRR